MSAGLLFVFCLLVAGEAIIAIMIICAVIRVKNAGRNSKHSAESKRARYKANRDGPHDDGKHNGAAPAG
jgi:hypothetical protein